WRGWGEDAQHPNHELMAQGELTPSCPVVAHRQPAAEALIDGVEAVARRGHRREYQEGMHIAGDQIVERRLRLVANFSNEILSADPQTGSRDLHDGQSGCCALPQPDLDA